MIMGLFCRWYLWVAISRTFVFPLSTMQDQTPTSQSMFSVHLMPPGHTHISCITDGLKHLRTVKPWLAIGLDTWKRCCCETLCHKLWVLLDVAQVRKKDTQNNLIEIHQIGINSWHCWNVIELLCPKFQFAHFDWNLFQAFDIKGSPNFKSFW